LKVRDARKSRVERKKEDERSKERREEREEEKRERERERERASIIYKRSEILSVNDIFVFSSQIARGANCKVQR